MKKPFLIAEVAQAHDGSLNIAHAFIDAVAKTKAADAIKFQTHFAEEESSPAEEWRKRFTRLEESRFEYWQRMEFGRAEWRQLKEHCDSVGLEFISSPFSIKAAELLNDLGMNTWKIASGEVTNLPLIDFIAGLGGQRVIISTGLCEKSELERCLDSLRLGNNRIELLACVSKYPSPLEEIDLDLMCSFKERYGVEFGLSDHSASIYPSLAAYVKGASVLEVHVTFHKDFFGPDNPASLSLDDLIELRSGLDQLGLIVHKRRNPDEENFASMRSIFLKSIVAKNDIPKGAILRLEDLGFKKPGTGISAADYREVIGKKLRNAKFKNELLTEDDLDEKSHE